MLYISHQENVNEKPCIVKKKKNYYTPIRIVKTKKSQYQMVTGCREAGSFTYHWWEYKMSQPLQKTVCQFLMKLNP